VRCKRVAFALALIMAAASAGATELEWLPPTTCTDGTGPLVLEHFTVYRDRVAIAQVPPEGNSYADAYEPAPGEVACYEITASA